MNALARFLVIVAASLTCSVLRAADVSRPNILFLFADDWGRYVSAYAKVDGRPSINDVIKTPNCDRVARRE